MKLLKELNKKKLFFCFLLGFTNLEMIWAENEPTAKSESGVDQHGAEQKPEHRGEGFLQRHDQHVISSEETQVA